MHPTPIMHLSVAILENSALVISVLVRHIAQLSQSQLASGFAVQVFLDELAGAGGVGGVSPRLHGGPQLPLLLQPPPAGRITQIQHRRSLLYHTSTLHALSTVRC